MEVKLGRGAGTTIMKLLEQSRPLLIVSPWIAPSMKPLIKGARVVTTEEGAKALEEKEAHPLAVIGSAVGTLTGLVLFFYDHIWALFLLFSPLLLLLKRRKLPPNVKVVESLHAKAYVTEDYVVVTSANLTEAGLHRNLELVLVFKKEEVPQLVKALERLWKEASVLP